MAKLSFDLFNQFLDACAKVYESTSIWKVVSVMIPVLPIDGDGASLVKDAYGWQIRMAYDTPDGPKYNYAEVLKQHHAAAANGYASWKIENAICIDDYKAVALSNGTIVTLDEYNKNKDALASIGVVVATHTADGKERADKGMIFIPKFDPTKPVKGQEASIKFVASPV